MKDAMQDNDDLVDDAIKYLCESGWEEDQAKNLLAALYNKDKDKFIASIPLWIEHVGQAMSYMAMLDTVASGLVDVCRTEDDTDWLFSLNEKGKKLGLEIQQWQH